MQRYNLGLFSEIKEDFDNVYQNDPAIHSKFEFIFNYPGVWAIAWYRIAHRLYRANWKVTARFSPILTSTLPHA